MVPGGAIAGVGDACQATAEHLAADDRMQPSIWLERGGRLWCAAATWRRAVTGAGRHASGAARASAGASAEASPQATTELIVPGGWTADGVVTRAFEGAADLIVPDLAAANGSADAACSGARAAPADGATSQICIPLRSGDRVVGVLDVKLLRPIEAADLDAVRGAADRLGARIARLGGAPPESSAHRLLRHVARLAVLEEGDAIARAIVSGALELTGLDSSLLVCRGAGGDLEPCSAAGPLGERLALMPAETLEAIARRAGAVGARGSTVDDIDAIPATPGGDLAAVATAGARTLVALDLVTELESHGLLLLAADRPVAISGEEGEALELLALHAAGCLRTAGLVRSLRERAATDPLTGLGHHATFHEALAASHRRPAATAIVLCDLDSFKRLNDTYGHQHGDGVLRAVASALSHALRRGDRLFRIGGDEFAALVTVTDEAEAHDAGLRLRQAVEDAGLGVTISVGIAVPRDGEPDAALLARADRALYRVKASGRDGVVVAAEDPVAIAPPL
jgi:diguanylate cyclase (GGDEF)-like protein